MKAGAFLVLLFLLFCFLFGVSKVFWKLKNLSARRPAPPPPQQQPPAPALPPAAPHNPIDNALHQIKQASALYREGHLTKEEFESIKKILIQQASVMSSYRTISI